MRRLILFIVTTLIALFGSAQTSTQGLMLSPQSAEVIPPAPSSAQQVRYQSPQPSLATGAVDYSIPLYTLEVEGLSIPFTLSYRTSGIKPLDDPLPCGYGWSLMPGFKVTRTIRGRADEKFDYWGDRGGEVADTVENSFAAICSDAAPSGGETGNTSKRIDTEKDIFNISLPHGSYTRIAVKKGSIWNFVGGGDDNEIVASSSDGLHSITAKDAEGNIYCFGSPYETYRSSDTNMADRRTAWALQYIELPSGRRIKFGWEVFNHDYIGVIGGDTGIDCFEPGHYYDPGVIWTHSFGDCIPANDGKYRDRIHLSKVEFPGGKIELSYTDRQLTGFDVYSSDSICVKTAKVAYGSSVNDKNLLKSVTINRDSRYTFDYIPLWNDLDNDKLSLDWWGYYNGRSNISLTPLLFVGSKGKRSDPKFFPTPIGMADRSPDAEKMKAGILRRITYPTGGYSEFDYEPHQFPAMRMSSEGNISEDTDPSLSFGGGLRIKSISTYERNGDQSPHIRRYTYDSVQVAAVPSASTFVKITYGTGMRYTEFVEIKGQLFPLGPPEFYFYRMVYVGYESDYMANRIGEEPIWYRKVTETYPEGKKEYSFNRTLPSDIELREWGYNTPVRMENVFSKGARIVRIETYASEANEIYRPVQTELMTYEKVRQQSYVENGEIANTQVSRYLAQACFKTWESPDFINGEYQPYKVFYIDAQGQLDFIETKISIKDIFLAQLNAGRDSPYRVDFYTIQLQSDRLKSRTVTQHLENGDFSLTDTYSYKPGTSIVTSVTTTNPADLRNQWIDITYASPTGNDTERAMVKANMIGIPIRTQEAFGVSRHSMRREMSNYGNRVFRPVREWKSRTSEWLVGSYDYDGYGNMKEYRGMDSVPTAYLWGYSSIYPVYSIKGSEFGEISRLNTSSEILGGSAEKVELRDLSENGNCRLITKALWKPLVGIATLRQPSGIFTTYNYDDAGRLSLIAKSGLGPTEQYRYHINEEGHNYMTHGVFQSPSITSERIREVVNYDGLGREVSRLNAVPESGYAAVLTQYDTMDRPFRKWAPVMTDNMHPTADDIAESAFGMYGTGHAYNTTFYESSPTERVRGSLKAGEEWYKADRRTTVKYFINTASGDLACPDCYPSGESIKTDSRYYPAGALTVKQVTDEEGHVTMTFTDKRGKTVMLREGVSGDWNDTRYVYDDTGDLLFVVQPGSKGTVKKSECFRYEYDIRGNCIFKSVPGGTSTRYCYDSRNRLFAEQDGNLRSDGLWLIHCYDHLSRPAFSVYAEVSDADIHALCSLSFTASPQGKTSRLTTHTGGYGIHENLASKIDPIELSEATYYDNYDFASGLPEEWSDLSVPSGYSAPVASVTGLETGVSDGRYITLKRYDNAGRLIKQVYGSVNSKPEYETLTRYDHEGKIIEQTDIVSSPVPLTQKKSNTFYPSGHLQKTVITQNGNTATIRHHYDGAGRTDTLWLGDKFRQAFRYNANGWLVSGSGRGTHTLVPVQKCRVSLRPGITPVFDLGVEEKLCYADSMPGAIPRYDGRISARKQNSISTAYTYDSHCRLSLSRTIHNGEGLLASTVPELSTAYTYDRNANITSLRQSGIVDIVKNSSHYGLKSELTMTYDGNHLSGMEIDRRGAEYEGRTGVSADGTVSGFTYDSNGNLTADPSRGIVRMRYNRKNLPTEISTDKGHRQVITYDGFGRKSEVIYTQSSEGVLNPGSGLPVYETLLSRRKYVGPHVFVNDSLEYSAFPGGYFTEAGVPMYYVKDWQGNNVAVYDSSGICRQNTTYYPYGEPTIEPSGQRYLFSGKEREHAGGRNSYDFGARSLAPYGAWTTPDPKAEMFYSLSPYSYCGGDPINRVDKEGEVWETVWDIGNVIYDVGAAVYSHVTGDHDTAKDHWADAGWDVVAAAVPFVPAGASKAGKLAVKAVDKGTDLARLGEDAVKVEKALKGAKSGQLRKALGLSGDVTAHHIIPVELLKKNRVVQDAVAAGFDFNGVTNGVKAIKYHGPHKAYNERIARVINEWDFHHPDYTSQEVRDFIEGLSKDIKGDIIKNKGVVK